MTEIPSKPTPEDTASLRANYQGNTRKAREGKVQGPEEKKVIEKVISGKVVQRKKSIGRRFADNFSVENLSNVWNFVLLDVLVPSAKAMIVDAMSKGAERAFYPDGNRRNTSSGNRNHTSYNLMSRNTPRDPHRDLSYRARATHDFNDIVLETRGEAEGVLDRLGDLLDEYHEATVNDLYDLVGITGSFTDDKWGWTDLRGAHVERVRDGYLLNMPRTTPIS